LSPILANSWYRLWDVGLLILLTFLDGIPKRVWLRQLGLLLLFCLLVFFLGILLPDDLNFHNQPRLFDTPTPDIPPASNYQYVLVNLSFLGDKLKLHITRNSLFLAVNTSTLLFTAIYSSTLYLLTTAPEEITAGLEELLAPLERWKIPITEIMLTLTLSLRFIPLVLEEVQNLTRSIRTRAINWRKLGWKNSLKLWLVVIDRLIENLLIRAEQTALAIEVRGFTSPNQHKVLWHSLKLKTRDWIAILVLVFFWWIRVSWGQI
jgi:energy-coupling factor transport system permease protein